MYTPAETAVPEASWPMSQRSDYPESIGKPLRFSSMYQRT